MKLKQQFVIWQLINWTGYNIEGFLIVKPVVASSNDCSKVNVRNLEQSYVLISNYFMNSGVNPEVPKLSL